MRFQLLLLITVVVCPFSVRADDQAVDAKKRVADIAEKGAARSLWVVISKIGSLDADYDKEYKRLVRLRENLWRLEAKLTDGETANEAARVLALEVSAARATVLKLQEEFISKHLPEDQVLPELRFYGPTLYAYVRDARDERPPERIVKEELAAFLRNMQQLDPKYREQLKKRDRLLEQRKLLESSIDDAVNKDKIQKAIDGISERVGLLKKEIQGKQKEFVRTRLEKMCKKNDSTRTDDLIKKYIDQSDSRRDNREE